MPIDFEHLDRFTPLNNKRKNIKAPTITSQHLKFGRIIFMTPESCTVFSDEKNYVCSIKGTLKKELKQNKDRITCGDMVLFDPDTLMIVSLQKRTSLLMRQNPSQKSTSQTLAANIDLLLITTAVLQPKLDPYLIDLYVISALRANITPVIVVNKIDLLENDTQEAQDEKKLLNQLKEQYQKLDIAVVDVSAKTLNGFDALKEVMKDKASVFSGPSGVGKSSLINVIEDCSLKVSEISFKNSKGTHTTTSSQLLQLSFGGWCVDTPGVQSIGFQKMTPYDVKQFFPEFDQCHCKFTDCLHQDQLGCNVKELVEKNLISELRLKNYYRLLNEVKES